jgi:uncharacterized DUF497 family protein
MRKEGVEKFRRGHRTRLRGLDWTYTETIYVRDMPLIQELLVECEGFDWDEGNIGKNWAKHRVTDWECEEIFFNQPMALASDLEHSQSEKRYHALGQTDRGRLLSVSFTIRQRLIRPISARDMNARERRDYENTQEDSNVQG